MYRNFNNDTNLIKQEIEKFSKIECKISNNEIKIIHIEDIYRDNNGQSKSINNYFHFFKDIISTLDNLNLSNQYTTIKFEKFVLKDKILFDLNDFNCFQKINLINFESCIFLGTIISKNIINNKFYFNHCQFRNFVIINSELKDIFFCNSEFTKLFIVNRNSNINNLKFELCEFKIFKNKNFKINNFSIKNCRFDNTYLIQNTHCNNFDFLIDDYKYDNKQGKINYEQFNFDIQKSKFNCIKIYQNNFETIEKLNLKDCEINNLELDKDIKEKLEFRDTEFEKINFKNSTFQEEFHFESCKVKNKANFSNTKFINNAYFNNTEFLGYADFHEAIFHNIASFYDVEFTKLMNFSSTIFKDFNKTNFVNVDIDKINISEIEKIIDEKYDKATTFKKEKKLLEDKVMTEKERDEELKFITLKSKIRWINNFRNSFRIIKHILLETNNSLDAQKFHKLELYAKEIELKYKSEKEYINFANSIDKIKHKKTNFKEITYLTIFTIALTFIISKSLSIKALVLGFAFLITYISLILTFLAFISFVFICIEKIFSIIKNGMKYKEQLNDIKIFFDKENAKKITDFSLYVDYLKLKIYRITSDHHTNFLQTFNFTISVIALYSLFILINKNINLDFIKFFTLNLGFTVFLISLILFYFTKFNFSAIVGVGFVLIFFWLGMIISLNITILGFDSAVIFFATLYIFSLILLCLIFSSKKSLIVFSTRLISYCIFFAFLFNSANLIIPFSNFNSNSQNQYLQTKLSSATQSEIINLASIINPEFNATKNPNSSENLSISELNEYKKFIVENKDDLYKKLDDNDKFKQAIYTDSSRDKTIKCISFIYAIILGLCLFSLQKTARRNSVVPS